MIHCKIDISEHAVVSLYKAYRRSLARWISQVDGTQLPNELAAMVKSSTGAGLLQLVLQNP